MSNTYGITDAYAELHPQQRFAIVYVNAKHMQREDRWHPDDVVQLVKDAYRRLIQDLTNRDPANAHNPTQR